MSKNNSSSIFGIILLLALLALNAYQWMTTSKLKSDLTAHKEQFLELEKVNTELDFNYQAKLEELEGLRGDNSELNTRIDAQKLDLAKQKKRISGLIWTEKELGKARKELTDLNSLADQYIAEINQLKAANSQLTSSNEKLTAANTTLSQDLNINKQRVVSLDSVKSILVSQTEELSEINTNLSSKVDMAEAIKVNYLEVKGYDVKDGGKLSEKGRAKKVDMLRTCFTTETNLVTPAGEKEFFIRYTNPIGEVLYIENSGSGSFTEKLNGEIIRYTIAGTADYNNNDMTACMDLKPNFKLNSGIYKVDIYNQGYQVGKGEFKLK